MKVNKNQTRQKTAKKMKISKPTYVTHWNLKSGESFFYTTPWMTECQRTPPAHKLTQPPNYEMEMG